MKQTYSAIPAVLHPYAGQIMDADSHEYTPVNHWVDQFGSVAKPFAEAIEQTKLPIREFVANDDTPIDENTVWKTKFARAPGAFDLKRRLEVMDFTGVRRQMVFPGSIGLYAVAFWFRCDLNPQMFAGITGDRKGFAIKMIDAFNDFCIRSARETDRLRLVGIGFRDNVNDLYATVKRLVDQGVRSIWLPSAALPGGVSPAHPDLYPVWDLLQASNTPLMVHVGGDFGFLKTEDWRKAPAFVGWKAGEEFQMDPWSLSTLHLATQNFLATLVLGGVFEAFPRLRFGSCEVLGQWVGPLAQNLDFWNEHQRKFSLDNREGELPIKMKPSEYIRRNVRISLFDIEPVDAYIEKFGMPEVYCYASDYPHPEGGKKPMTDISDRLKRFSPDIMRKVFVENGEWLLPD
jgi:predicted TIM-barrel fold metal-dependent hydrolase